MKIHTSIYMYACMHACMYVCPYASLSLSLSLSLYIYICVCVCSLVYSILFEVLYYILFCYVLLYHTILYFVRFYDISVLAMMHLSCMLIFSVLLSTCQVRPIPEMACGRQLRGNVITDNSLLSALSQASKWQAVLGSFESGFRV